MNFRELNLTVIPTLILISATSIHKCHTAIFKNLYLTGGLNFRNVLNTFLYNKI